MKELPATCDASVLVPALHRELPGHESCRVRLATINVLPAHVLLEAYRVLTGARLLPPLPPEPVANVLGQLGFKHIQLPPGKYLELVQLLASAGRPAGAIYDAQIAATAKHHGLRLLSRDRRAAATYDLVGVDYELI